MDFGCGQGAWLLEAQALGVKDLQGLDGDWVDSNAMRSAGVKFRGMDLAAKPDLERRFDLAMSLEVAEHISPEHSETFVGGLCSASDVVLFGAAVPDQGGTQHVNEQHQSYWASLFKARDYRCYDIGRRSLWDDRNVDVWYKPNTFLYVKSGALPALESRLGKFEPVIFDMVHPDLYAGRLNGMREIIERKRMRLDEPPVREVIGVFYRFLRFKRRKVVAS